MSPSLWLPFRVVTSLPPLAWKEHMSAQGSSSSRLCSVHLSLGQHRKNVPVTFLAGRDFPPLCSFEWSAVLEVLGGKLDDGCSRSSSNSYTSNTSFARLRFFPSFQVSWPRCCRRPLQAPHSWPPAESWPNGPVPHVVAQAAFRFRFTWKVWFTALGPGSRQRMYVGADSTRQGVSIGNHHDGWSLNIFSTQRMFDTVHKVRNIEHPIIPTLTANSLNVAHIVLKVCCLPVRGKARALMTAVLHLRSSEKTTLSDHTGGLKRASKHASSLERKHVRLKELTPGKSAATQPFWTLFVSSHETGQPRHWTAAHRNPHGFGRPIQ